MYCTDEERKGAIVSGSLANSRAACAGHPPGLNEYHRGSSRTLAQPALTTSTQLSSLNKPYPVASTAPHGIFFMHSISGRHYLCKHSRSTLGVTFDPSFPTMSRLQPVATLCSITTVLLSPSPLSCSGLCPLSPGPFLVLWFSLQQSLTWIQLPVFQTCPFPNTH